MTKAQHGARKSGAGVKPASQAALDAAAEAQTPLEPSGPGVEHEDHEGGETDSLARLGVRAPLQTAEEREEAEEDYESVVRAPSVRERQTGLRAAVVQGGVGGIRGQRRGVRVTRTDLSESEQRKLAKEQDAADAKARGIKEGSVAVPVIATRLGYYPAEGRLRAPGEAFEYILGPEEEELPSWMEDPTGKIPTRDIFAREPEERTVIEVRGKTVSVVEQ
jgi:hypothetical protein